LSNAAVSRLLPNISHINGTKTPVQHRQLPEWRSRGGTIEVQTKHYTVEFAEDVGGGITRAWCTAANTPVLKDVSNDLISYKDSGGLWRMGYEFRGGTFKEIVRASYGKAQLQIREYKGGIEVICITMLEGESVNRLVWFDNNSPLIRMRIEGRAVKHRTVTVRFATNVITTEFVMDAPGGVISRPSQKFYNPTFWPLYQFMHAQDKNNGRGLAILTEMPGALSYRTDGHFELVALRNAPHERAFGFLPVLAMPASCHEHSFNTFEYSIILTSAGNWQHNCIPSIVTNLQASPWKRTVSSDFPVLPEPIVTSNSPEITVSAIKPASRGSGIIARLSTFDSSKAPVSITVRGRTVKAASLCDARERDIEPLVVNNETVHLTMPGTIATVRLII
jgi:hypothetical protein